MVTTREGALKNEKENEKHMQWCLTVLIEFKKLDFGLFFSGLWIHAVPQGLGSQNKLH